MNSTPLHRLAIACLLFLLAAIGPARAQTPGPLVAGIHIDSVTVTQASPNRLAHDPATGLLYYCLPGGDVYSVVPGSFPASQGLVFTIADHGITHPQGLHFRDSCVYISGNTTAGAGMTTARISRGRLGSNGLYTWSTVVETMPHPYSLHPFTSVVSDPQGQYLYWASGARTMLGEVWTDSGQHPGRRETPYNSRLYRIPIGAQGLVLPADSAALDSSGHVFCHGLRNAYSMAFDADGQLFAIDNSGERDDPEELNWLRQGLHYGFPWRMGDHWNPLRDPAYDASQDPLVNPLCGGYLEGRFAADSTFPSPTPNLVFTDPLRNLGPDADKYRDSTGAVRDASDDGMALRSFTAHRSPLGLVIDRDSLLPGAFARQAYLLGYMPGGDSTGMSPVSPWGTPGPFVDPCQDLLQLDIRWEQGLGEYVMEARRIADGFYLSVDAVQVGTSLYVLEHRGGGRANLWRITFSGSSGEMAAQPRDAYGLAIHPNPAHGAVAVHAHAPAAERVQLLLLNMDGRPVWPAEAWSLAIGDNTRPLDTEGLPAGTYLLRIQGKRGAAQAKLVLQ